MYQLVALFVVSHIDFVVSSGVSVGIQEYSHPVNHQYYTQDGLGSYVYGYITPHSTKTELRSQDGVTKGGYSYIDPHGEIQTVEYTADAQNGFRVATTNLPKDDPEVSYARHKHFEEFERIVAEHKAIAAEHAALAAKLSTLSNGNWENKETVEKNEESAVEVTSEQEKLWKNHLLHYRTVLQQQKQLHVPYLYGVNQVGYKIKEDNEGQEQWENSWEAQRLRDIQTKQSEVNINQNWEIQSVLNQNNEQHKAAIEAHLAAERKLIAEANEERNRQLQALQRAQQLHQESVLNLERTRINQHSIYENEYQTHHEAARLLEEARLRQEEAERKWYSVQNNQNQWSIQNHDEKHRLDIEAGIKAQQELIARAQEERNHQIQAYQDAIQRYRESEIRLQQTKNEQTAAYEAALSQHREAARRLSDESNHHETLNDNRDQFDDWKAAHDTAARQIIAHTQEIQNLQSTEEYRKSDDEFGEKQKERKIQNDLRNEWQSSNRDYHLQQLPEEQLTLVRSARDKSLEEAEKAFNEFKVNIPLNTIFVSPLTVASPKLYTPIQNNPSEVLDLYSYGSIKIPDIKASGSYSYIDNNGVLQTMQYVSDHLRGFRLSDVNSVLGSGKVSNDKISEPAAANATKIEETKIAPKIQQEEKNGSIKTNEKWENDNALYQTEIKYE